jgi:hypothetical protein
MFAQPGEYKLSLSPNANGTGLPAKMLENITSPGTLNGTGYKVSMILPNGTVVDPGFYPNVDTTCSYTGNHLINDMFWWTESESTWMSIVIFVTGIALIEIPWVSIPLFLLDGLTYFGDVFQSNMQGVDFFGTHSNIVDLYCDTVFDSWGLPVEIEMGYYTDMITIEVSLLPPLDQIGWISSLPFGTITLGQFEFIPIYRLVAAINGPRVDVWPVGGYRSPELTIFVEQDYNGGYGVVWVTADTNVYINYVWAAYVTAADTILCAIRNIRFYRGFRH